jgi:hypothetical protein
MDEQRLHALADRCRELARAAARDDTRQQLREWAHEFESDADTAAEARSRQE